MRDFYAAEKARSPVFSYRFFAMRAGYSSPVILKLVMDDKRNLSPRGVEGFGRAPRLKGRALSWFRDLVAFGQAKSLEARNSPLDRLRSQAAFNAARALRATQFDYLSHWYMPAIREMVRLSGFVEDAAAIALRLRRRLPLSVIQRTLEMMLELGLLVRGSDGQLRQSEAEDDDLVSTGHEISTGYEVPRLGVFNFHRQLLECASTALLEVQSPRRHFNALTFAVPESQVEAIKERINAFVEEIATLAAAGDQPDAVYQLHVTLYPHTAPTGGSR